MFKSEPKAIVQFLATHFDLLKQLFDIQSKNGIILENEVHETLNEFGSDVESQLFDHKILVEHNDDYLINEAYFTLFEFVLHQFKPLLPEEINKFDQSIERLYLNIKQGINQDKNILLDRIEALSNEIKRFRSAVLNNTVSLLDQSRELKANTKKIEYHEKVQKAKYFIDHYIIPLNSILDTNHSQSIYNKLLSISQYSNNRRFDYSDESMRRQFEKLYNLLKQVVRDISGQSNILNNELLPLLDRIRTESEYLQGFIYYLTNMNCYKEINPPKLMVKIKNNPYNSFIYENTKEYFEQFENEEEVIVEEEYSDAQQWIFSKSEYKSRLNSALPVTDFFSWCKNTLESEKYDFSMDDFFMVTSLIFEQEYEVQHDKEHRNIHLKTDKDEYVMPKLNVNKKENVSN